MKQKFITIILIALIILNILDGDFANPSVLDYVKLALIAIALILSFITEKRKSAV